MMKLKIMKDNSAIEKTHCVFCGKIFQRETSLEKHLCERKRRYLNKDDPASRIAYQAWLDFFERNTQNKKKTLLDFVKSSYYNAFYKFGKYCVDVKCIQPIMYLRWLNDNKIRVDEWAKDIYYDRFLKEYLRIENPYDALARSIETITEYAKKYNVQINDFLRYGNHNVICHLITNGKISPWIIYNSNSGIEFLENLQEGLKLSIIDYVDPEKWALIFYRNKDDVKQIKQILSKGNF